jgi:hypothetical protein
MMGRRGTRVCFFGDIILRCERLDADDDDDDNARERWNDFASFFACSLDKVSVK